MSRFTRWSTRSNATVVVIAAIALMTVLLVTAMRAAPDASTHGVLQFVLLGAIAAALLAGLTRIGVLLAGVDPDAELIANRLAASADERRLLARWLNRTRWARNVGGIAGLVWWVLGTSAQGDVLLYGIAGVTLGSMAAQLHHARPRSGLRTASLDQRRLIDHLTPARARPMVAAGIAALGLVAGGLLLDEVGSAARWGSAALVVLGATVVVQARVAGRPRPLLGSGLRRADDLARELAIVRGLAQPATYLCLALVAHGAGRLEPALGGLATVLSVIAWLTALRLWWRNRRLGLDHLLDAPPQPTVAEPVAV